MARFTYLPRASIAVWGFENHALELQTKRVKDKRSDQGQAARFRNRYNVVHPEPFVVQTDAASEPGETPLAKQRFTVASKSVRSGERVDVTFAAPMHAASGERFWITIVTRDTADTSWGT